MKTTHLIASLCAVVAAGTLHAQVIGDFEGSLESGWLVTAGVGTPSTIWASTGAYSLRLTPGGGGFSWALQYNNLGVAQNLASSYLLLVDVNWISSEWQPDAGGDGWVRWDQASLNSDTGGWSQTTDANISDPANPSYPGSWDPNNWGASHTRTLTYNMTTLGNSPGGGWGQFNMSFNFGNIETTGNFYIDNVRVVPIPEPASLALLGLGGALVFLRRRTARA